MTRTQMIAGSAAIAMAALATTAVVTTSGDGICPLCNKQAHYTVSKWDKHYHGIHPEARRIFIERGDEPRMEYWLSNECPMSGRRAQ